MARAERRPCRWHSAPPAAAGSGSAPVTASPRAPPAGRGGARASTPWTACSCGPTACPRRWAAPDRACPTGCHCRSRPGAGRSKKGCRSRPRRGRPDSARSRTRSWPRRSRPTRCARSLPPTCACPASSPRGRRRPPPGRSRSHRRRSRRPRRRHPCPWPWPNWRTRRCRRSRSPRSRPGGWRLVLAGLPRERARREPGRCRPARTPRRPG
mmetsp:Transcript_75168/g.195875  ORF Transcript_75168/g.195875 Transcript_75168/m.195875 type:complete len:211 (+) Transcript_75168:501-1133(+)